MSKPRENSQKRAEHTESENTPKAEIPTQGSAGPPSDRTSSPNQHENKVSDDDDISIEIIDDVRSEGNDTDKSSMKR
jgi:hypothetical protein